MPPSKKREQHPCHLCGHICSSKHGLTQHYDRKHRDYLNRPPVPNAAAADYSNPVESDTETPVPDFDGEEEPEEEPVGVVNNLRMTRSMVRPRVDPPTDGGQSFQPLVYHEYRLPPRMIGEEYGLDEQSLLEIDARNDDDFFVTPGVPINTPRENGVVPQEELDIMLQFPDDFSGDSFGERNQWWTEDGREPGEQDSDESVDDATDSSIPTVPPPAESESGNVAPDQSGASTTSTSSNFRSGPISVSFSVSPNDSALSQKRLPSHDLAHLRLVQLCDRRGCPRNFVDELVDLLQEIIVPEEGARLSAKSFQPDRALRREALMNTVYSYYGDKRMAPIPVRVRLCKVTKHGYETGDHVLQREERTEAEIRAISAAAKAHREKPAENPEDPDAYPDLYTTPAWNQIMELDPDPKNRVLLVKFNIQAAIESLLSDETVFGNLDNLVVNKPTDEVPDASFRPYRQPVNMLDEVLDGTWYKDTLERMSVGPEEESRFILPLIGYVDKTGTDKYNRYSLEPFSITTAIHRRKLRYSQDAWRVIGLIPDLEMKSSMAKKTAPKGYSTANYHECLAEVLRGLGDLERNGFVYHLRLGDRIKEVRIHCPLAFVMGDAKSGDSLCCRFGGHNSGVKRVCRSCDVEFKDLNRPDVRCHKVKQTTVSELVQRVRNGDKVATQCLKDLSMHPVVNGFEIAQVKFGGDDHGILGCSPSDLMHA